MNPCRKINISLFLVVLIPLLFSGCLMGPDFQAPEVETPTNYRFDNPSEPSMVNLKWWELFDDPVLYDLVTTAQKNNKDLKVAASRIEEARALLGFTKTDRYPRIDIEAGASRGTFSGTRSETTNENYYVAPVLSWELDFWGKFRRSTEAARAELMATDSSYRTIQLGLISEVASTYYLLLDYHQRLQVSIRTLDSRLKSLDIIQQRFDAGIIPEIDLNQAQIQKELAAESIPLYERLIAQTEHALSVLLGELPHSIQKGKSLQRQGIPPDIPVGLPSTLLERRPDISESMYLLKAQSARIGVAEALRLPSISLTGLVGLASSDIAGITSDGDIWSIGGNAFGPLFDFQQSLRRVEVEQARTEQLLLGYEKTVLTAFREVEDALVEVQTYKQQIIAKKNRAKAAKNANSLSRDRYDGGVTSYLEVLDSERTLFDVELQFSETKQEYLNSYVKLYKALGGGWSNKEELEKAEAEKQTIEAEKQALSTQ